MINGGTAGDLSAVTSITFNYQADLSGITGYNVGATSVTDISTPMQSTIIASVNGTDITIYSSQPTVAFPEKSTSLFSVYEYKDKVFICNIQTINWGNVTIDTSSVTSMYSMFSNCTSISTLDVSEWDTSSVTDMHAVFSGCESISTLDVSKWDTSSATTMSNMFNGCKSLTSLDLSGWDVAKVTDMGAMFNECTSLVSLNVSGWDTSNVTDMYRWYHSYFKTANDKYSTVYLAQVVNSGIGTNFTGFEDEFYVKALDAYMGTSTGYSDAQAKQAIEQQYHIETEQVEPAAWPQLKMLNMSGWTINEGVSTTDMFFGLQNITTFVGPKTCNKEIWIPVTLYDTAGNEYTSLSSATNGKTLLSTIPEAAGFDGAELVAITSVGVLALIAVGYALISNKKRKESKFNV